MKLKPLMAKGIKYLGKHSPTILAGFAVVGVIGTGVLAGRGHLKAYQIIEEERDKREKEAYRDLPSEILDDYTQDEIEDIVNLKKAMSRSETFKMTWLCYLPAGISAFFSIAAIIASNSINQKRLAAMSILLSSAETALSKYEDKVTSMFGKAKADKIKSEIANDMLPSHTPDDSSIVNTKHGDTLFFDRVRGLAFRSSMEYILQQQNDFNADLLSDGGGDASLNDWYYMLGLDSAELADVVGFTKDVPLKLEFNTKQMDDGQQITLIDYQVHPRWDDRSRATLF